jgi:hypothetical protein
VAFRRVISVAAAAATVGVFVLVLPSRGALAQEGDPAIVVEQAHPANNSVHYFVKLAADGGEGAPIDGATVTATPTSPDGSAGQPVELQGDGEGIYQGSVGLSEDGDWTVTFASTDPAATLTYDQTMPGEPFEADDAGGGESSPVFPLLFAAAFLLTLAGMGVWALLDRRRNQDGEGSRGEDVVADPGIDDAADAHLDVDAERNAAEDADAEADAGTVTPRSSATD